MSEIQTGAKNVKKGVGTPSDQYNSMRDLWSVCRAIVRGEEAVKAHDKRVYQTGLSGKRNNILIPFSRTMTQAQYEFYKEEAELPGITGQYVRTMIGALLRKESILNFSDEFFNDEEKEELLDWIKYKFTSDNKSLFHFLDSALWEEFQTSATWIQVELPAVSDEEYEKFSDEQKMNFKPYPVIIPAEQVINVQIGPHPITREYVTTRFITRQLEPRSDDNPWHPDLITTVRDHYLDKEGYLVVDVYEMLDPTESVTHTSGKTTADSLRHDVATPDHQNFDKVDTFYPKKYGERLSMIPVWPLNGDSSWEEPLMMNFINREKGLYNKVSRRNHLLYGTATYTPIIKGIMDEADQSKLISAGLGSYWFVDSEVEIETLQVPTDALSDYQTAIESAVEEIGKLGIRMLSPETNQSGVALEIRNAAQTASLGTLNAKVSSTIEKVIRFMIEWDTNIPVPSNAVEFTMSSDFSPQAQGGEAMSLISEWYQLGLIPRSLFIETAKKNDYISSDYNDDLGQEELTKNPLPAPPGSGDIDVME